MTILKHIAAKLKPTIVSDLISAVETLGLVGSVIIGDFGLATKLEFDGERKRDGRASQSGESLSRQGRGKERSSLFFNPVKKRKPADRSS